MPSGQQGPNDAGQRLPILVPGSKGEHGRCVGWVGVCHSGPLLAFSLFGKGDKAGGRNCRGIGCGFCRGQPFAVVLTKQKAGLPRPGAGSPRPAGRKRSAQFDIGLLVHRPPWQQNVGPADHRSLIRKRDHQRTSVIGKEIGLAAHLLRGVVDIGDGGLPTRSHGKMREVIGSRSLRGGIQFPRRQGGKYGSGFKIQRQSDDRLCGCDFERSGKAGEIKQSLHILRTMPSGRQFLVDAGQRQPSLVPGSKGDDGLCGGWVCIGHSGPRFACSLFGKGDKPGGRNGRRIDSGFRHGRPFAVALTKQKAGLHRPRAGGPRPAGRKRSAQPHVGFLVNGAIGR